MGERTCQLHKRYIGMTAQCLVPWTGMSSSFFLLSELFEDLINFKRWLMDGQYPEKRVEDLMRVSAILYLVDGQYHATPSASIFKVRDVPGPNHPKQNLRWLVSPPTQKPSKPSKNNQKAITGPSSTILDNLGTFFLTWIS